MHADDSRAGVVFACEERLLLELSQVPVEPGVSPQPTTPPLPKSPVYLLSKLSPVLLSCRLSVSVDVPRIE